jgi:6-pyruvoyl-tetrahydropterin synthase
MPFFILLVIILMPFALFFSLARWPFAKRRIVRLKEIITEDWLPRKKYIYIGYNDDLPITKHIEQEILPKYKDHVIYDKWSSKDNKWEKSEPDTHNRVTTIWQDIASDFDGEAICILAVLTPKQNQITKETLDVYYFNYTKDGLVFLEGRELSLGDAEKKIDNDIKAGVASWKDSD